MSNYLVCYDIGHGKSTWPETNSKGIRYGPNNEYTFEEHWFNAEVVLKAKKLAEYNKIDVLLTQEPHGWRDSPLVERTNLINKRKPNVVISFHADASDNIDANGFWNFYWYDHLESKKLADLWDRNARKILPNKARVSRALGLQIGDIVEVEMKSEIVNQFLPSEPNSWTNFHITRVPAQYNIPSTLLEHAFFTNPQERELLKTPEFQYKCAVVAVKTCCDFLGVNFMEPQKKDWREELGLEAVNELHQKGYIDNLEYWKDKMLDRAENWFVMEMFRRLENKGGK